MLSETCRHAIKAMIYINSHKQSGRKLSLTEIAEAIYSPAAFTGKILQKLRKSGLLSSSIGAHGGYWVDQKKGISLKSIIEVIDGNAAFTECVLGLSACSSAKPCPLHEKNSKVRGEFTRMMEQSFLDDYTDDVRSKKLKLK